MFTMDVKQQINQSINGLPLESLWWGSGRRPNIDWNTVSEGSETQNIEPTFDEGILMDATIYSNIEE